MNWLLLCKAMMENHGLLPNQIVDMPLPQLAALAGGDGKLTKEEALAIHRQRLIDKGIIKEGEE